VESDLDKP